MKLEIPNIEEEVRRRSLDINFKTKYVDTSNMPSTFGVPSGPGYNRVIETFGDLERQLSSLNQDKRVVSLNVGCCDSGTGNADPCFDKVIEYLTNEKITGNTYLLCDPKCDRFGVDHRTMREELNSSDFKNNIILGHYLSNTAGWDCADARNISHRISNYEFNDDGSLSKSEKSEIMVLHKINNEETDNDIFISLFK